MRFFAFLVFLLFCAYALFARYYYVCEIRGECVAEVADLDIRPHTLALREGDRDILMGYDECAFDSASVSPRLNDNNRLFLDTVAQLLKADTSKNLTIRGFYRESEATIAPGIYENLGTARADATRRLLMKRGIAEDRIQLDHGTSLDAALSRPLAFEFYIPADIPEGYESTAFSFTNMTYSDANFAFDSDVFKPGDALILYADSVKTYLDLNPVKRLTIIGHTDNRGTDSYNYDLGLRRAKNARVYFVNLGITSDIAVESKGEKVKVASNDTAEGRQRNRRVNFVLQ